MTTYEILEGHYLDYCVLNDHATKYEWAAEKVFGLLTYDYVLDDILVNDFIDVCRTILNKDTSRTDSDLDYYKQYIIVFNILRQFNWVRWRTDIMHAWFDDDIRNRPRPIISTGLEDYGVDDIPFTVENLETLFDFIEH